VTYLSVPVKLVSTSLTSLVRHIVNELLARTSSPRRWVDKQVVQVEVGIDARSRRVRVVGCKADGLAISVRRYGGTYGVLRVEETLEGDFCHVVGDGALVESVVLTPEVLPCLLVGGPDWADLDV